MAGHIDLPFLIMCFKDWIEYLKKAFPYLIYATNEDHECYFCSPPVELYRPYWNVHLGGDYKLYSYDPTISDPYNATIYCRDILPHSDVFGNWMKIDEDLRILLWDYARQEIVKGFAEGWLKPTKQKTFK